MISVEEAKKIINQSVIRLSPVNILLEDAWDHVLAEDIYAPQDIPAYPQSSMDGYAFAYKDLESDKQFSVLGESAAGNRNEFRIGVRTAARIFTGAAVPEGADTVVMQEKIKLHNGHIVVDDETLTKGSNVRSKGSEIKKGALALPADAYISAAAAGFLAGIGITTVKVYPRPVVGIIVTGNELKKPGLPLEYGEVYESNSYALTAALKQFHLAPLKIWEAKDDPAALTGIMKEALQQADLLLLTGGVSVGEYDFVTGAAAECGITTLFHKIKQRPGKPLYFGMKDNKVVFGLPGNPSSVLTCFYEYVIPALRKMTNGRQMLEALKVPLAESFIKKIKFTQFLKGYYDGTAVLPLPAQESYRMNSFATSNCLVVIEETVEECRKGELVEIHLIV